MKLSSKESRFKRRVISFLISIFIIFFIFFVQLFNLQIIDGEKNSILAKKFANREEYKIAPRGFVFDSKFNINEPLISNYYYFNFVVYPARFSNYDAWIKFMAHFCKIMKISCDNYYGYLTKEKWKSLAKKNEKITLLNKISRREHERIIAFQFDQRYGTFESENLRFYFLGHAMAHISGYVGQVSTRDIREKNLKHYQISGKSGLELFYDEELRGKDGVIFKSKIFDTTSDYITSLQGNHLILNIDKKIQEIAYKALQETKKRGTVIVMKSQTGEILALASYPSFDPNLLSQRINPKARMDHYNEVVQYKGFINLATQAKFPPASTFKPFTAIAALEENPNEISTSTTYFCPGFFKIKSSLPSIPDSIHSCHKKEGHGHLDMLQGIAQSCNVYFFNLGYKVGPTSIIRVAKSFRFDKLTQVDLPGEIQGFIPDQIWKQVRWSSKWYDGDTINLSVGQGFMEITPISLAVAYSAIANGGKIIKPFIVREIRSSENGRVIKQFRPYLVEKIKISDNTLRIIKKGLREVVLSGTAKILNQPNIVPIAGKTGTVQTRGNAREGIDHAWFVGFAPYDEEERYINDMVTVVVFVEKGIAGSASGAPIALKIFKEIFPKWKEEK